MLSSDGDETIADEVRRLSRETYGNDPLPEEPLKKTIPVAANNKKATTTKQTATTSKTPAKGKNPEDDDNLK